MLRRSGDGWLADTCNNGAVIRVIGVGSGGCNAVGHMVESGVEGVEFVCTDTDSRARENTSGGAVLHLGTGITDGFGAGGGPDLGRQAALEDRGRVSDLLEGAAMVLIVAGMGGGTGTVRRRCSRRLHTRRGY